MSSIKLQIQLQGKVVLFNINHHTFRVKYKPKAVSFTILVLQANGYLQPGILQTLVNVYSNYKERLGVLKKKNKSKTLM